MIIHDNIKYDHISCSKWTIPIVFTLHIHEYELDNKSNFGSDMNDVVSVHIA